MKKRVIFIRAIFIVVLSICGQLRAQTTSEETFPPMPWAKDAIDSVKTLDSISYHKWGIIPEISKLGRKTYNVYMRAGQLRIQRDIQSGRIDTAETTRLRNQINQPPKPSRDTLRKGSTDEIQVQGRWGETRFFTAQCLEPAIAVNPKDDRNLISACMYSYLANGIYSINLKYTQNQGVIWYVPNNQQTITYDTHGDPSVTFDAQGKAYICYMDFQLPGTDRKNKIVVDVSTNQGVSWSSSDIYVDNDANKTDLNDKPWITCDTTTGRPYSGSLYATWTHYSDGSGANNLDYQKSQIWLSYKRPNGNWQRVDVSDVLNLNQGASTQRHYISQPVVDASGNLYVFWRKSETTAMGTRVSILMKKSIDGGQSFQAAVVVAAGLTDIFGVPMDNTFRAYTAPSVVATRRNGTDYLYVAWADSNSGKPEAYASYSTDGGTNWLGFGQITTVVAAERWAPTISAAPNGHIVVSFYERLTAQNKTCRVAIAEFDAGSSVTERIESTPQFSLNGLNMGFYGDYIGIAATNYSYFTVFSKDEVILQNIPGISVFCGYREIFTYVEAYPSRDFPVVTIGGQNSTLGNYYVAGGLYGLSAPTFVSQNGVGYTDYYSFLGWYKNFNLVSASAQPNIRVEGGIYRAEYSVIRGTEIKIKNEFRASDPGGGQRSAGGKIVYSTGLGDDIVVNNTQDLPDQAYKVILASNQSHKLKAVEQQYGSYYRGFNPRSDKDGGWVFPIDNSATQARVYTPEISLPRPNLSQIYAGNYIAKYRNRYDVQFNAQYEFDPMGLALPPQQVWQYESGAPAAAQTPLYNSTSGASRQYDFQYWTNGITTTSLPAVTPTDNTSYTAFYKAHLLSSAPTATGGSGQRRLVQARNNSNSYYFVYESGNKIYVTHSTDGGSTWQPEKYIGIGKNPSLISIDNDGVMIVWLNHLLTDPSNSTLYRPDIQSRIFYSNGSPLTPTHSVCYTGNTDGSVGPADQPYTGIFGSIVSPTSNAHPVGVDLAVGNNPYGRLICWEAQGRAFNAQQNPNTTLLATARFYFCCNTYNENYWRQHNVVRTSSDSPPFTSLIYPAANADLNPTMDYIAPNLSENSKIKLAWQTYLPNGSATDPIMTAEITVNLDATAYTVFEYELCIG